MELKGELILSGIEERDKNHREWDEHSDRHGEKSFPEIHHLSCSPVLSDGFSCFAFAFTSSFEPALESSAANKRVFSFICSSLCLSPKGETWYFYVLPAASNFLLYKRA